MRVSIGAAQPVRLSIGVAQAVAPAAPTVKPAWYYDRQKKVN